VLDEIDKIAASQSGTMPGERLNKDISGESAQKVLLKLMEGAVLSVPNQGGTAWDFNARNTLIVGAGAFSALRHRKNTPGTLGFGADTARTVKTVQFGVEELTKYGMQEEFVGRFSSITCFDALGRDDLRLILERTLATRYKNELLADGVELSVDPQVPDLLVEQALAQRTGARGLTSCLSDVLQDALFDVYSTDGVRELRLVCDGKQIGYEVIGQGGKGVSVEFGEPSRLISTSATLLSEP